MDFQIFESLFEKIDKITLLFVNEISSKSIASLTPIIVTGLSLTFITYSLMIVKGAIEMPLIDFFSKSLRTIIITSIISAGGLYQTRIATIIQELPDSLATKLLPNSEKNKKVANIIDRAAGSGFDKATDAFDKAGFLKENGISFAIFGIIIVVTTGILTAIGGTYLILSKLALSLLAGLAPFFIAALLFEPLHRFFDLWVAQVLNYIILVILFSAIFGLMMTIFGNYMHELEFNEVQKSGYIIGGAIILSCAMIMILKQLPTISAGLSGGFSMVFRSIPGVAVLSGAAKGAQAAAASKYRQSQNSKSSNTSPSQSQAAQGYAHNISTSQLASQGQLSHQPSSLQLTHPASASSEQQPASSNLHSTS